MVPIIVFGLLGFCTCILLAWYFAHQARHKERMLMIEKGMNPELPVRSGSALVKIGIVVIGLSVGLGIVEILNQLHVLGNPDIVPLSILGLSGGTALILANHLSKPKS